MEKEVIMESLKDLLNIRFDKYKEKTAFIEKSDNSKEFKKMSYQELKDNINGFGTVLLKRFNLKDEKIAVIGENSSKWYETYLAVVCGVGVIVPLDKELPANEIYNLLKRSNAKCIVYSSRKKELIESIKEKLPEDMKFIEMSKQKSDDTSYAFDELVNEGKELVATGNTEYIDTKIDREKFSMLLFTSGTTAAAKGVMLSHKNLCADIYSCYDTVPMFGKYTCLSVLPMHHTFEFTLTYLFMTSVGGTIAICEGLKYIVKNLQELNPDFMVVVPELVEKMVSRIEKNIEKNGKTKAVKFIGGLTTGLSKVGIDLRRIVFKEIQENFGSNLKYFFCGGAPLDKEVHKKMESFGFKFLQGYGLTETSPLACGNRLNDREPGTVGKAVYGEEIRIDLSENDDENSNIGEIIVRGDNVFIGYYENETETKKALKKGWFYTGDLGYFDLKGNLVIAGRNKNVIVTPNGKKIFPEEIEQAINKIGLVEDSMVYGKSKDGSNKDLIVACMVTLDEEYIEDTYASKRPTDKEIYDIIWEEIKKINKTMVAYKAVKELEIKKDKFVKTTTMKIKRFEELKKKGKKPQS